MKQIGFFDESDCLRKLSKLGDQLEKLNRVINWEIFESILNRVLERSKKAREGVRLTAMC